ncbi:hypothetical protein KPL78_13155 [Roseomonas sp. HJA6]|uniref:DUF4239 domain-containing protein n=1 Tax=Roseomonas alba TaxID=2846776 RepID=A0ABS7A9M9_9PROT|nr:hypothetical protein [Neoroseomonas alba]MBW6398805.1 hypothetical protein [Neoroseomonas alba]
MTLLIGAGVFVVTFAFGLVGLLLHRALLEDHRSGESKDVVRLVQAFIASIATLVLGLLIASANTHYREQADGASALAADIMVLDGALAHTGPAAASARAALRRMLHAAIDAHVLEARSDETAMIDPQHLDAFYDAVAGLQPANAAEHAAQQQALAIASRLVQARTTLLVRDVTDDLQWPFLAVLVSWLSLMFLAMGLFVRANTIIVLAIGAGALAVSGAIFMILELQNAHAGLLRISDAPLRFALEQLGHPIH